MKKVFNEFREGKVNGNPISVCTIDTQPYPSHPELKTHLYLKYVINQIFLINTFFIPVEIVLTTFFYFFFFQFVNIGTKRYYGNRYINVGIK